MNHLNAQMNSFSVGSGSQVSIEPSRPITNAMSELASAQGDLETAARALVSRIASLIPGGSPFDFADQRKDPPPAATSAPAAVASTHCGDINARIWGLRQITERLNEAARGIEI